MHGIIYATLRHGWRGHGQINFYLMQVMSGHGAFNAYLFHVKLVESPNAPNVIKEGEMMMPGTPCLSVQHFKGRDDHSSKKT